MLGSDGGGRTFPTAASPSRTSLTLLLGFGAPPDPSILSSVIQVDNNSRFLFSFKVVLRFES